MQSSLTTAHEGTHARGILSPFASEFPSSQT